MWEYSGCWKARVDTDDVESVEGLGRYGHLPGGESVQVDNESYIGRGEKSSRQKATPSSVYR